jgi:hypothetical protein
MGLGGKDEVGRMKDEMIEIGLILDELFILPPSSFILRHYG